MQIQIVPRLAILTEEELEAIHQATLIILNEIGINLKHPQGRKVLIDAGARIENDRVLFPNELVEDAIADCPSKIKLNGRDGKVIEIGGQSLHWHNMGGARDIYDPKVAQKRPASLQDVRDSTRVLDALENVSTITPLFTPQDVPGKLISLAMYRNALSNTSKIVRSPGLYTADEVKYIIRMTEVIGTAKKLTTIGISPVSPLHFPNNVVEAMIEVAQSGISLEPIPAPMVGATSPMSLAGSLTQQNAELLASLVLAQSVQQGTPVSYCGRLSMIEPRTGISVWGGVELGMASAATVQIAHHYGLRANVYGLCTNAHFPDYQNGFERALNALLPAQAGADELSGIGQIEAGISSSYVQMVLDNELVGSINRSVKGITVNEDALALEVIEDVIGSSKTFLGQRHTVKYMRTGEVQFTKLAERRTWEQWDKFGREGMLDRAESEAERIISEHEVIPLTDDQEKQLDDIMEDAKQKLVKRP
ncbi:MAG: trimethylamine methyltransferase family protein [Candidatus Kariarchaeaceae archaeon]|jgi:trimethylamine--corrinoid protein Co-methyltransferase